MLAVELSKHNTILLISGPPQHQSDMPHPRPEVNKLFSCYAQLRLKFIQLINVKMPTIVGILTFISRINYMLW